MIDEKNLCQFCQLLINNGINYLFMAKLVISHIALNKNKGSVYQNTLADCSSHCLIRQVFINTDMHVMHRQASLWKSDHCFYPFCNNKNFADSGKFTKLLYPSKEDKIGTKARGL
jgi:hypothetical protein